MYFMPGKVRIGLEKIMRHFFVGSHSEGRKTHLVNWMTISKEDKFEGLEIRKLDVLKSTFANGFEDMCMSVTVSRER